MVDFNHVVVPVDGSEGSKRAVHFAARLAHATRCPLKLMHVCPATATTVTGLARLSRDEVEKALKASSREAFDKVQDAQPAEAEKPEEIVVLGDPAEEILGYIEQHPDALVVMGRRGLSRLGALLVGSVSEKVARHSRGAVTLVG